MIPRPPRSTLFPYTTLCRSQTLSTEVDSERLESDCAEEREGVGVGGAGRDGVDDDPQVRALDGEDVAVDGEDRKSTRLNSSHANITYAVFCLKKNRIVGSTA